MTVIDESDAEPGRFQVNCPMCGRSECRVSADYRQATRTEPRTYLGASGYCPDCRCCFEVGTPMVNGGLAAIDETIAEALGLI